MFEKYEKLKNYLKELEFVAVAFSSGVDSAFLLKTAHDVLKEKVFAITAKSFLVPEREIKEAKEFCNSYDIKHIVFEFDPFEIKGFNSNPKNRCYICKKSFLTKLKEIAFKNSAKYVLEGSNVDDLGDYRPGLLAVKEEEIISPLIYAALTKAEIRELSNKIGLKAWDKPSFACLASRVPYGEEITKEKLLTVDKSEELLYELGFKQFRVRIHNDIARIEILEEEFLKLINHKDEITAKLKQYGFKFVSLDLSGYKTGSLNG